MGTLASLATVWYDSKSTDDVAEMELCGMVQNVVDDDG